MKGLAKLSRDAGVGAVFHPISAASTELSEPVTDKLSWAHRRRLERACSVKAPKAVQQDDAQQSAQASDERSESILLALLGRPCIRTLPVLTCCCLLSAESPLAGTSCRWCFGARATPVRRPCCSSRNAPRMHTAYGGEPLLYPFTGICESAYCICMHWSACHTSIDGMLSLAGGGSSCRVHGPCTRVPDEWARLDGGRELVSYELG